MSTHRIGLRRLAQVAGATAAVAVLTAAAMMSSGGSSDRRASADIAHTPAVLDSNQGARPDGGAIALRDRGVAFRDPGLAAEPPAFAQAYAVAQDGTDRRVRLAVETTPAGVLLRTRGAGQDAAALEAMAGDLEARRAQLLAILDIGVDVAHRFEIPGMDEADLAARREVIVGLTLEELSVIDHYLGTVADWDDRVAQLTALHASLPAEFELASPGAPAPAPIGAASDGAALPDFDPLATVPAPVAPTPFPATRDFKVTQQQMQTGYPPAYPVLACPASSEDRLGSVRFVFMDILTAIDVIGIPIEFLCKYNFDTLGFGTNAVGCIPSFVFVTVREVFAFTLEYLDFCAGLINSAEIQATYENTRRIMARLNAHDRDMLERFRDNQVFLQDLEASIARQALELNAGSADDDPIALLQLPVGVCRDLQGPAGDFRYRLSSGANVGPRRQCGLLGEVDRAIVELRALVAESGLSTNAADAEIAVAQAHLAAGEYKAAYARYRKAYRELASSHTVP